MICITAKNFIDGGWREPADCFESPNPADVREIVGTAPRSTPADVERALLAAAKAFPKWSAMPGGKRAEPVDNFAQVLKRYGREVAKYISLETGKAMQEASAEVAESLALAQHAVGRARAPYASSADGPTPSEETQVLRRPRGVLACITPCYDPVAVPLRLILPALIAGNTVVWKPSEKGVAAAQYLSRLFLEGGFLEGAVNIVHGPGDTVGKALAANPAVSGVLFSGSGAIAEELRASWVVNTRRSLYVEPDGVNAQIVLADADLDQAVSAALSSAFLSAGMRRESVDRIIVVRKVLDAFTDKFVSAVAALRIGAGQTGCIDLGPLSGAEEKRRRDAWCEEVSQAAEAVLYNPGAPEGETLANGYFVSPFVWRAKTACFLQNPPEPARCPVVAIVPVGDVQEAVEVYNAAPLRHALSVFTQDARQWQRIRDDARFEEAYLNLPTTGTAVRLPIGDPVGPAAVRPVRSEYLEALTFEKHIAALR